MRLIVSLCLLISTIFLPGCNEHLRASECATFSKIEFEQETKDWLGGLEWPETAYGDFNEVRSHNTKWEQRCS